MTSQKERSVILITDDSESDNEVVFESYAKLANGLGKADSHNLSNHSSLEQQQCLIKQNRDGDKFGDSSDSEEEIDISESKGIRRHNRTSNQPDSTELQEQIVYKQRRRIIVFQVMCSGALILLHYQAGMIWFWNSLLFNISDSMEQTLLMWCVTTGYIISPFIDFLLIDRLPYKWTLALGCLCAGAFTATRIIPKPFILAPVSFIFGLSFAPFGTAATLQISRLSSLYEGYRGGALNKTMLYFVGIVSTWIAVAPIWIAILHSVIAAKGEAPDDSHITTRRCGFYYEWPWSKEGSNQTLVVDGYGMEALLGACLVCVIGGLIMSVVVLNEIALPSAANSVVDTFKSYLTRMCERRLILFGFIVMNATVFQTFCYTVFLQSYIACGFSINDIFYCVICIGLGSSLSSFPWCWLGQSIGRVRLLFVGHVLCLLMLLALFLGGYGLPYGVYFIITFVLGILCAMLETQVASFTVDVFKEQLPYFCTISHLAKAVSIWLLFILTRYHGENSTVCLIVIGICVLSTICHVVLEVDIRVNKPDDVETISMGQYVRLDDPHWLKDVSSTQDNEDTEEASENAENQTDAL